MCTAGHEVEKLYLHAFSQVGYATVGTTYASYLFPTLICITITPAHQLANGIAM